MMNGTLIGTHGIVMTLSKEYRLRLVEICTKMKLQKEVSLEDRIWAQKLIEHNQHAAGIYNRLSK